LVRYFENNVTDYSQGDRDLIPYRVRESPKEKDHLKDEGIDGRMGSKWILGRLFGGEVVEWIHLTQVRDGWGAFMNAVMNLRLMAPRS
jgi:hypothetical protein